MQAYKRQFILIITDIIFINIAYILALLLVLSQEELVLGYNNYLVPSLIILRTFITITIYISFGLYSSLWRYASVDEFFKIILAVTTASVLFFGLAQLLPYSPGFKIFVATWMLKLFFCGGSRFFYRLLRLAINSGYNIEVQRKNILIYGAGEAGAMVINELKNHTETAMNPVVVLDDDPGKHGRRINGISVMGGREKLYDAITKKNIDEIIIAIPSASTKELRKIIDLCKNTECKLKTVPGMYEFIDGRVDVKKIRDVQIEDLLGRDPIELDCGEIDEYLKGQVVLVTGGGGSIGSELCRQIAVFNPKTLIIFDIYENNAYNLQLELQSKYPDVDLKTLIGSVQDKARLEQIFKTYRPSVVFHAAAHKHVPLMEDSPTEAIKNNVFGTMKVAQVANEYKARRFVLISTDKAVNPTNIMGATKRTAEMIIQMMDKHSKTEYVAVRFGNVLGSNGSVIPLFKKQIAQGGPITVTHPDIIRYFMTIPEASQLVLQAGALAQGGEIFILDMGEPVKIVDLAKDLIKLSGFTPGVDIKIEFTGLRPGEKLYEELLTEEEGLKATKHQKILVGKATNNSEKELVQELEKLKEVLSGTNEEIYRVMKEIIPTFRHEQRKKEKPVKVDKEVAISLHEEESTLGEGALTT